MVLLPLLVLCLLSPLAGRKQPAGGLGGGVDDLERPILVSSSSGCHSGRKRAGCRGQLRLPEKQ